MGKYNQYIEKLKKHGEGIDFDRMYAGIKVKTASRFNLLLAGGIAALLLVSIISFSLFYSTPYSKGNLMSYVFEREEETGSPVLEYVFANEGGEIK